MVLVIEKKSITFTICMKIDMHIQGDIKLGCNNVLKSMQIWIDTSNFFEKQLRNFENLLQILYRQKYHWPTHQEIFKTIRVGYYEEKVNNNFWLLIKCVIQLLLAKNTALKFFLHLVLVIEKKNNYLYCLHENWCAYTGWHEIGL